MKQIIWRFMLAVLSGILLSGAYPPFAFYETIWFWLCPLLFALWTIPSTKCLAEKSPIIGVRGVISRWLGRCWVKGFALGWVSGFVFHSITLSWLLNLKVFTGSVFIAALGLFLLSGYLALYFGIFGAVAVQFGRLPSKILLPKPRSEYSSTWSRLFGISLRSLSVAFFLGATWCGLEWIRGIFLTGFGWNGLGVPLSQGGQSLLMIQSCEWIGVTGLSFLPVFTSVIALVTVWRLVLESRSRRIRPHFDFGVAMALVSGFFLYGLDKVTEKPEASIPLHAVVVQPNINQLDKWNPEKFDEIREALAQCLVIPSTQAYDLVLMPESCLPQPLDENLTMLNEVMLAGTKNLVYGTDWFVLDDEGELADHYNAIASYSLDGVREVFHKMHLVAFGEYVPFSERSDFFAWVGRLINVGNISRGSEYNLFSDSEGRFDMIPTVCFEDTVARQVRRFVKKGTQLIVNSTNDAWFGISSASEQHLQNAMYRSVELRRPMLRSTNTGTSAYISEKGQVTRLLEPFTQGTETIRMDLVKDAPITFYAKHGDIFSVGCLIMSILSMVGVMIFRTRKS